MLGDFFSVSLQVLFDCLGLVKLEPVGIRVGGQRGVVAQCTIVGDVHPNGGMVSGEITWFQVPTLDCRNVGCAPHSIHDFAVSVPEERGRSCGFIVLLEDQVVHAKIGEKILDALTSYFFIQIASHYHLITFLDPFLKFSFQVFHERHSGVPIIILVIEISLVLGPGCSFSTRVGTRPVNTDHPEDHSILASEPRPSPSS